MPAVSAVGLKFANYWWANRVSIVSVTIVNTVVTTGMEFGARSIHGASGPDYFFFVDDGNGHSSINRQTMINIIMTVLLSLLGGPIYFFRRKWTRYVFFILFGTLCSMAAQVFYYYISADKVIEYRRVLFDLVYMASIRYLSFEVGREQINEAAKENNYVKVGGIRTVQKFCSVYFKVALLNFFNFRG